MFDVQRIRVVFGKWGSRPHWEYAALHLGEDEHGAWLGLPRGTRVARPGRQFETGEAQVVLVPEAPYVATFYSPGGTAACEVYVDVSTRPVVGDGTVTAVDLDLDVVRDWSGRVWVDDEDEFAAHREAFGYPEEVVDLALATCEEVRRAVLTGQAPFDGPTAQRWLRRLDEAMMLR
jgi:uncharacterized protein